MGKWARAFAHTHVPWAMREEEGGRRDDSPKFWWSEWPVWPNLSWVPSGGQFGQIWVGCHLVASLGKFELGAIWWPVWANLCWVSSGGQFGQIWFGCHLVASLGPTGPTGPICPSCPTGFTLTIILLTISCRRSIIWVSILFQTRPHRTSPGISPPPATGSPSKSRRTSASPSTTAPRWPLMSALRRRIVSREWGGEFLLQLTCANPPMYYTGWHIRLVNGLGWHWFGMFHHLA